MKIVAEQEHYLLLSDGKRFAVVERRAGKFYPLCNSMRHGSDPDDERVNDRLRGSGTSSEGEARKLLADVAGRWRDLSEHIR
jgi:hypothetical protein